MPPKNYKTALCLCSKCVRNIFVNDFGQQQHGMYQRPSVAQQHRQDDFLRQEQEQERLENAILLGTVRQDSVQQGDMAVRRRDLQIPTSPLLRASIEATELHVPTLSEDPMDIDKIAPQLAMDDPMEEDDPRETLFRIISSLQSALVHKSRRVTQSATLVFESAPSSAEDEPGSLLPTHVSNSEVIALRDWINTNMQYIDLYDIPQDADAIGRVRALKRQFGEASSRIQSIIAISWEQEKIKHGFYGTSSHAPGFVESTERHFQVNKFKQPFLFAAMLLSIVLHALASVSRPEVGYILATIKVLVYGAFVFDSPGSSLTEAQTRLLKSIPGDVRTLMRHLDLEPDYILYACCPVCFALYPPNAHVADDPYPRICAHRPTPTDDSCSAPLVRKTSVVHRGRTKHRWVPIKPFAMQSLRSWLGQLLSRPGIERFLETSWEPKNSGGEQQWSDIMDAPALRQFVGPDGSLFSEQRDGAINLVFSLFVDWFNPFGNKKAGKSHSVGAIYMAVLNLPPELRYRTENIFLAGIIPGPHEPSLEQLNHFLSPLVDQLLALWHSGVYLSRTAARTTGRLLRAAMIPLVCDLPALRKVAGFAGHSNKEHFCSFCRLSKAEINNLDRRTWKRRTWAEHLEIAMAWRDAGTSAQRDQIFEQHGLRWSELLRLPYWDPTKYALVDAMHNLYLGELRHHCMEVLGIDVKERSTDSKRRPHAPEEQAVWLSKVSEGIKRGSTNILKTVRKGYLAAVADFNGVVPSGTTFHKKDYISALISWYKEHRPDIALPPVMETATNDFHSEELKDLSKLRLLDSGLLHEIRADIKRTVIPSWLESPPSNFGSPGHGKLKAAQWRTVCTVNMVISLIRVWGTVGDVQATKRNRQLLHNFMDLVLAVEYATRRTMSSSRAASFDAHMMRYVEELQQVLSHDLVPNHHLSLHLRECIELFGPVHAWWAFPFERYNGLIAQLKTNYDSSEMPLTFLRYFCIGSTLRWLMSSYKWPNVDYFENMVTAYKTAFGDALRGLFTGVLAGQSEHLYDESAETCIDTSLNDLLLSKLGTSADLCASIPGSYTTPLQPFVQYVKRLSLKSGLTFATATGGKRDSFITFRGDGGAACAGQIEKIFYHRRVETDGGRLLVEPFFLVKVFVSLDDNDRAADPYRIFHGLNTYLAYNRFKPKSVLLQQKDIISHFAAYIYTPYNISKECIVVRSLDRE